MSSMDERIEAIRCEHESRVQQIGSANANRELYVAFAAEEMRHDALKAKILDLVQIIDRRGPFLPPLIGRDL